MKWRCEIATFVTLAIVGKRYLNSSIHDNRTRSRPTRSDSFLSTDFFLNPFTDYIQLKISNAHKTLRTTRSYVERFWSFFFFSKTNRSSQRQTVSQSVMSSLFVSFSVKCIFAVWKTLRNKINGTQWLNRSTRIDEINIQEYVPRSTIKWWFVKQRFILQNIYGFLCMRSRNTT